MSKALIVGAAGFVGSYLARELKDHHGMEVHATKLAHEQLDIPGVAIHDLNILNKDEIVALLYEVRPDYIFHLAAQSSVSVAWKNPGLTIDINVKGSVNLMDAVRELFYKPRVLLIGSGEEYGHIREGETPLRAIARHYLLTSQCTRFMEQHEMRQRKQHIADLAKAYKADGIIVASNKFCEYWSYERVIDTVVLQRDFGYPVCSIEKEYINAASGQLRTRFQAFIESVEIKKIQEGVKR